MDIDEELFNLILQIGTYNGTACYDSRRFLGIEKSNEYFSLATKRINESSFCSSSDSLIL